MKLLNIVDIIKNISFSKKFLIDLAKNDFKMRYLGIDLGSKTVGLAISDTTLTIASSLKTIFFKDEDYLSTIDEIKNIIKEYDIQKIILGLPKNMNNTLGERAEITTKYNE